MEEFNCLGVLFISEGRMEEINRRIDAASVVPSSMVVNPGQGSKE